MTERLRTPSELADEAAALIDRMHADYKRVFEILVFELTDEELIVLSDDWYVDTDAIVIADGDDLSTYTTLEEWVAWGVSGGDGGEHWLVPPRRPLRIDDVLDRESPTA